VDDPQKLGRVRVSLPGYGDPDAGWLGVLCPGAGQGRGIVALPDVDDTVLVALPHGVPAEGVVLGSLYGTVEPPDAGIDGGAVRRWSLRTADGQSVVVDDDKHSIRLQDKGGSFVELTPDLVRVHANTDLTVEAPGHAMTLRANTIDFVQATGEESGG
jgi:phage baseplate assembly protein gpV